MTAKEKSTIRAMRTALEKWPSGYFCFICGEPISIGKLCKKHKNYFNAKLIEEYEEHEKRV